MHPDQLGAHGRGDLGCPPQDMLTLRRPGQRYNHPFRPGRRNGRVAERGARRGIQQVPLVQPAQRQSVQRSEMLWGVEPAQRGLRRTRQHAAARSPPDLTAMFTGTRARAGRTGRSAAISSTGRSAVTAASSA